MMRLGVLLIPLLGSSLCLVSCASSGTGAEDRKEGYDRLVECVRPGMSRRQLYAVLPPMEKPAQSPSVFSLPGGLAEPVVYEETHRLDEECYLTVGYHLKNQGGIMKQRPSVRKLQVTRGEKLGPDSIDDLLHGFSVSPASPADSEDKIIFISKVLIDEAPAADSGASRSR